MCSKCIDRVSRMKQNTRRTTDVSTAARSMSGNDTNLNASSNEETLSNVMTLLRQMNDTFTKIDTSTEDLKLLVVDRTANVSTVSMDQKLTELHAKIDQHLTKCTSESKNSSLIIQKLNALQVANISATHASNFVSGSNELGNTNTPVGYRHLNRGSCSKDPLNWSFSFNQSSLPNDNAELYQLLHGFERNTWTTFDHLRQKLNENTDTVQNIESICKDITSVNIQQRLNSPVTDSIKLDALQMIQGKCDVIEEKVNMIDATMRTLYAVGHQPFSNESTVDNLRATPLNVSGLTTQHLRERLQKLVSSDGLSISKSYEQCGEISPPNINVSSDNMMNYQVIDELLTVMPSLNDIDPLTDITGTTHQLPQLPPTRKSLNNHATPNNCVTLEAARSIEKKWFYVSNLRPGTTESMVKSFITNNLRLEDSELIVKSLLKRDHDPAQITFTSFKIGFDTAADTINLENIWPANISISEFIPKNLHNRRHR